ncbi:hypothetical protein [Streptomyces sp900116325]|uniref:hypothetical protein n=1 Tax=Streptomyces sp. 900116325 TaxID=3154295 RepID=UPI00331FE60F
MLLLAYATGCAEPRFFEQPCLSRLLKQVIQRVRLAARLCAPFLRRSPHLIGAYALEPSPLS